MAREIVFNETQQLTMAGTEVYAAPEQFEEGRVKPGAHTDVYGLAATFYTLVTGQVPYPAKFRADGLPLKAPREHNSRISKGVSDGIMQGIALEVSDRCGDVAAFFEALGIGKKGGRSVGGASVGQATADRAKAKQFPIPTFSFETVRVDEKGKIIQRIPGKAEYWDVDLGNGVSLTLVRIPAGEFMMGSPDSEAERDGDEGPQHRVQVREFWLGKYLVTQAQWRQVASLSKQSIDLKSAPSRFKGDNRPVEQVSGQDAQEFCRRVSQQAGLSGMEFGLPSEAQWEYACRAGSTTPFAYGPTLTPDLANYDGNYTYSKGPTGAYRQETTAVGQFPPNAWGLYDMHGNLWEWCADNWHNDHQGAPSNDLPRLVNKSTSQLLRGGSWCGSPGRCRSASRRHGHFVGFDLNGGFRLALFRPRT